MSNCLINLRILFWHFKYTTDRAFSFSLNRYLLKEHRSVVYMKPIALLEFRLAQILGKT